MKKIVVMFLALAMVVGLFAACTTPSNVASQQPSQEAPTATAPPAPASVELTVVTSYGGDDGNRGHYEAAIAGYEAETGNKVLDASATSNEQWKAKVMTDFQAGTEPDVLFYFLGNDANDIVNANKVVSLDEIRAAYPEYASNMREEMLVPSPADKKVYAVPSTGYWESMFVNKKVLEASGVQVPGPDYTWEQFLADCGKIKAAGFTPVAVSLQEVPHYWFDFAVFNNGSLANHLDLPASSTDAVGQKWVSGLNDIKQLYDLGYLPENTLTATDAETAQIMADGTAAFMIDGSWKVGFFTSNVGDRLGDYAVAYVPGKGDRKASDIIGGISMGYYITRKAWDDPAKREAAVKFVEYLTSDAVLSTFVTTEVTALKNNPTVTGLNSLQQSAADMVNGRTGFIGAVQDLLTAEVRGDLFANIKNIVAGNMTAAEAIDHALAITAQ